MVDEERPFQTEYEKMIDALQDVKGLFKKGLRKYLIVAFMIFILFFALLVVGGGFTIGGFFDAIIIGLVGSPIYFLLKYSGLLKKKKKEK